MIAAKWRRLDVSRAMHEPLVEVGGAELVRASAARGASLVADLLRSSPEIGRVDVEPLAVFLVMACTSMLQIARALTARSAAAPTRRVATARVTLRLVQPGAALAEKRDSLGREHEGRSLDGPTSAARSARR